MIVLLLTSGGGLEGNLFPFNLLISTLFFQLGNANGGQVFEDLRLFFSAFFADDSPVENT